MSHLWLFPHTLSSVVGGHNWPVPDPLVTVLLWFHDMSQLKTIPNTIKVPLTPKCFLNRNKTLFGVDYFGEKISAIGLFLHFL